MTPSTKPIRIATGALAVATILASLAILAMCVVVRPFIWVLFGFELISLFAGAFLLVLAIRRRADALSLACIGGTIFVAGVLGHIGTKPPVVGDIAAPGVDRPPGFLFAGALGVLAALLTLRTDKASWRRLLNGTLLGVPLVLLGAALAVGSIRSPLVGIRLRLAPPRSSPRRLRPLPARHRTPGLQRPPRHPRLCRGRRTRRLMQFLPI